MQHFLLSAAARTLSLKAVFRMGEDKAYQTFCELRWPDTDGEAICPRCGCTESYSIATRRKFKCFACYHQFSVTSGTIFASRKLSFTDLLAAIVIFVNGAKGVSALQVSRDLDVQYKTAFVLSHKLREAMAREDEDRKLAGEVEIDGAYFGGYVKPANWKQDRKGRRLLINQTGKRQSVIVIREREDQSVTFVGKSEAAGVALVRSTVANGTISTRTRLRTGTRSTASMRPIASTTARAIRTAPPVPTKRRAFSAACAEWKSVRTTTSPGRIWPAMQARRHGAKITAGCRTVDWLRWSAMPLWLRGYRANGRDIGSERPN